MGAAWKHLHGLLRAHFKNQASKRELGCTRALGILQRRHCLRTSGAWETTTGAEEPHGRFPTRS